MDTLGEIGSGIGNAAGAVGNELGALPGQIGNLFSGGGAGGDPTGGANPGAGGVNGTPGAVAPAAMAPAGTGASGGLPGPSAAASGGLPLDLSQITGGGGITAPSSPISVDPIASLSTQLTGPATPDALSQGLAATNALPPDPTVAAAPVAPPSLSSATPGISAPHAAAAPSGLEKLFGPTFGKAAGIALPFALNALSGQPGGAQLKQMKALETQQQALAGENATAAAAETQGQLPQPAQALIQEQLQHTIAQIKSQYAQAGLSGSSAENADIAAAKENAVAQQFAVGNQMATTALGQVAAENNLSDSLLKGLYESEVGQSKNLQDLITRMAGLLTGPAQKAA